jgi:hypothetical protein
MNKKAKAARFDAIGGRSGISARVLEIAREIVAEGSYKRAIIGAGQIRALAEVSEADTYWDEKCDYGYQTEQRILNGARKVSFTSEGSMIFEEPIPVEPDAAGKA